MNQKEIDEFDADCIAQEKKLEQSLKEAARAYLRAIEGDTSLESCKAVGEHLKGVAIMWAQIESVVKNIEKRRTPEPRRTNPKKKESNK